MRRLFAVVLMSAVLMGGATLAFAQSGPVMLEFKGVTGSELRYETSFNMNMEMTAAQPGGGVVLTVKPSINGKAVTVTRVAGVADNGDLTFAGKVESFDVSLDVADLHARLAIVGPDGKAPVLFKLPELPIQMVLTRQGKPISLEGMDKLAAMIPSPPGQKIDFGKLVTKSLTEFSQPVFPDYPVSVGDSWEWKLVIDPMEMMESMGVPVPPEAKQELGKMQFPIKNTSTLVAFETVDGVECAKIEAVAPWELNMPIGPPGEAKATLAEKGFTRLTTWFDYAAGRKVRELTEVSFDMSISAGSETPMKMVMRGIGEKQLR